MAGRPQQLFDEGKAGIENLVFEVLGVVVFFLATQRGQVPKEGEASDRLVFVDVLNRKPLGVIVVHIVIFDEGLGGLTDCLLNHRRVVEEQWFGLAALL